MSSGRQAASGYALITGGAGFIGTNLAHRLLKRGQPVVLLDTLERPGAERNVRWLRAAHGAWVRVECDDCRNRSRVFALVSEANQVFHLAGQVAVTASLVDPVEDFEVNLVGTLNVLEAVRRLARRPPLIFASTHRVYGALQDLELDATDLRYVSVDPGLGHRGIDESRPLDPESPHGCSKGAADQYVLDYARSFGLPAAVLRLSSVYGPHQLCNADQGWVGYVFGRALRGQPITIYGDGRQVRDVLFIDDLVNALLLARDDILEISGRAFNVGGGPEHTTSPLELLNHIQALMDARPRLAFEPPRAGDQRWYVSDISSFRAVTGWSPRVSLPSGLEQLWAWLRSTDMRPVRARLSTLIDASA